MILLAEKPDSEENSNWFIITSFLTWLTLASVPVDILTLYLGSVVLDKCRDSVVKRHL